VCVFLVCVCVLVFVFVLCGVNKRRRFSYEAHTHISSLPLSLSLHFLRLRSDRFSCIWCFIACAFRLQDIFFVIFFHRFPETSTKGFLKILVFSEKEIKKIIQSSVFSRIIRGFFESLSIWRKWCINNIILRNELRTFFVFCWYIKRSDKNQQMWSCWTSC